MCVCVCEREREREKERKPLGPSSLSITNHLCDLVPITCTLSWKTILKMRSVLSEGCNGGMSCRVRVWMSVLGEGSHSRYLSPPLPLPFQKSTWPPSFHPHSSAPSGQLQITLILSGRTALALG